MEKDEKEFPKPTLSRPFCSPEQCTVWPEMGSWDPWQALLIPR